jgi:SAM-dependent methyltransferase
VTGRDPAMYGDGAAWAAGPDRVYRLLADAAVRLLPGDLSGLLALDAGAGTGAVGRALRRRGARTVSSDASPAMLAVGPVPAFAGDIRRLPVRDGAVDLAAAAMVLSHLAEPDVAMAELVRVTGAGGVVLVTAFASGRPHPVKAAVDRVLAIDGYREPDWYAELKSRGEPWIGSTEALRRLAGSVRLGAVQVDEIDVDLAGLEVPALVGWRLGMAQVAPYLAGLDPFRRKSLTAAAADAVAAHHPAAPLGMLVLRGRHG